MFGTAPYWVSWLGGWLWALVGKWGGQILAIYAQMFHHLIYGFPVPDRSLHDGQDEPNGRGLDEL